MFNIRKLGSWLLLATVVPHELVITLVLEIGHHGIAFREIEDYGIAPFRILQIQASAGRAG